VPAQFALFAYLVVSTLAIGYACLRGMTLTRRLTVCLLVLILEVNAGLLMVSRYVDLAYAVGIPCMLALGVVMTSPRKPRPAAVAATSAPAAPRARQVGHRAARRGIVPARSPDNPWALLTASTVSHVAYSAGPAKGTATSTPNRGRRASDRGLAGRRVAARDRHRGRQASASFTRSWRCKHR
jgi:hypothetical protein